MELCTHGHRAIQKFDDTKNRNNKHNVNNDPNMCTYEEYAYQAMATIKLDTREGLKY